MNKEETHCDSLISQNVGVPPKSKTRRKNCPPASKTDESQTRESESEALSGVDERTAQSLKSVDKQPSPEPVRTQSPPPLAPEAEELFPLPELVDEQPFPPAEPVSDQPAPSQEPVDDQSPPEPVERISLSRILSMNLDRSESAASEKETPLDITLESGEGETPLRPKRESSKISLKPKTGEGALPFETQTPGGETPLSLASTFVSRVDQPAEMAEPNRMNPRSMRRPIFSRRARLRTSRIRPPAHAIRRPVRPCITIFAGTL